MNTDVLDRGVEQVINRIEDPAQAEFALRRLRQLVRQAESDRRVYGQALYELEARWPELRR